MESYWREYWHCKDCKKATPFKEIKASQILIQDINFVGVYCQKCDKLMKPTTMKETK